jgi:two-component system chemotaxis response regulator CheY
MSFNILIVDDSETTRALIRRSIQIAQLPVGELFEAGNGAVALQQLKGRQVDLILADLHMPEMNGVELAKAVLGDPATKSIPVAIVSAEPSATRIAALRQAGVKGYLRKPFTPESLNNLVRPFLEGNHAAANRQPA